MAHLLLWGGAGGLKRGPQHKLHSLAALNHFIKPGRSLSLDWLEVLSGRLFHIRALESHVTRLQVREVAAMLPTRHTRKQSCAPLEKSAKAEAKYVDQKPASQDGSDASE
eukprot:CAMPEP_0119354930 /NCGR_PEP_ID=MMETSP1334-20130426/3899_1 /TAXON_ID=127549 /ORGANISM="Calcidiscus leptoporus, Strain RCC1130" /LENGTH=109 /DNA_ID=CAMNT_0007368647 /DNA_START=59 /DNA_END=387 /DNA_ORIENTATION=-